MILERNKEDITRSIYKMIEYIGDDPAREGVEDTPKRVVKSWNTIFGGYKQNPEDVLKTQFAADYDEMVVLKDIEFYSTCEHHMLPFFGKAHVAYLPNGKVVGISKLARLVEIYARRLQIQERLTTQIAQAIMEILNPFGCGVIMEAKHFCMVCRGVEKQNSIMTTSSLEGTFRDGTIRQEFFNLI
jgi:GTP cyclohydrolase IA